MQINKKDFKEIAIIALKLLVICAIVACLVATVNFLTKDKIVLNQKIKTAEALTDINKADGLYFSVDKKSGKYIVSDSEGNIAGSCEASDTTLKADIDAVYVVKDTEGKAICYCVEASPMGFKNEVGLIVAVNPDRTIKDVQIISLSDTKGIGDKVTKQSYLDLFKGKTSGFSKESKALKASGMIIAGATRTSEPVSKAVDTAVSQVGAIIDSEEGAKVE